MLSSLRSVSFWIRLFAIIAVLWVSPESLYSQAPRTTTSLPTSSAATGTGPEVKPLGQAGLEGEIGAFKGPSLITQAVAISFLSLLPFIIMLLTPFMKIVIVLSLLRGALGVQQAPPNQVLNGVAFMLALFIMYPVGLKMYDIGMEVSSQLKTPESITSTDASMYVIQIATAVREPMREFLKRNASAKHEALFYRLAYRILPEEYRDKLTPSDFMIVMPSFITSQLKDAFEIGVLIYIPFFVIDIVTSNILLAMGMMMLSPVTISMPLKLFLLVMLDGWTLLVEGLVNTFH